MLSQFLGTDLRYQTILKGSFINEGPVSRLLDEKIELQEGVLGYSFVSNSINQLIGNN